MKCKCKYVNDSFDVWNHQWSHFRPTGPTFTSLSTNEASVVKYPSLKLSHALLNWITCFPILWFHVSSYRTGLQISLYVLYFTFRGSHFVISHSECWFQIDLIFFRLYFTVEGFHVCFHVFCQCMRTLTSWLSFVKYSLLSIVGYYSLTIWNNPDKWG